MAGFCNTATLPDTFTITSARASRDALARAADDWSVTGTWAEYKSCTTAARTPKDAASNTARPNKGAIRLIKPISCPLKKSCIVTGQQARRDSANMSRAG